jgi:hypothetical protein
VLEQLRFVLRGGPGAAGIADQMNDKIATADVVRECMQQCVAALLEILLHLDLERATSERTKLVGELQAIRAKLAADGGNEKARRHTNAHG